MRLTDAGVRVDEIKEPLRQFIRNVSSALSDDFDQTSPRANELRAASIKLAESGVWAILTRHNQITHLQSQLEKAKEFDGSDEIESLRRQLAICRSRSKQTGKIAR